MAMQTDQTEPIKAMQGKKVILYNVHKATSSDKRHTPLLS